MHGTFYKSLIVAAAACLSACQGALVDTREGDDSVALPPSHITGSHLVSFDDARVRCGFEPEGSAQYRIECHVVKVKSDSQEVRADVISDTLTIQWSELEIVQGSVEGSVSCLTSPSKLSQTCNLVSTSPSIKLKATLNLRDTAQNRSKAESDTVLLPYSVHVAAGYVPEIPFQFTQTSRDDKSKLGYQPISLDALDIRTDVRSSCVRDNKLYIANDRQVFVISEGRATLFAGHHSRYKEAQNTHRLRAILLQPQVWCVKEGLLIKSGNIIYLIDDKGSLKKIADIAGAQYSLNDRGRMSLARTHFDPDKPTSLIERFFKFSTVTHDGVEAELDTPVTKSMMLRHPDLISCHSTPAKCFFHVNKGGIKSYTFSEKRQQILIFYRSFYKSPSEITNPEEVYRYGKPRLVLYNLVDKTMTDINYNIDYFRHDLGAGFVNDPRSVYIDPQSGDFMVQTFVRSDKGRVYSEHHYKLNAKHAFIEERSRYDFFKDITTKDPDLANNGYYQSVTKMFDAVKQSNYYRFRSADSLTLVFKEDTDNNAVKVFSARPTRLQQLIQPNTNATKTELQYLGSVQNNAQGETFFISKGILYKTDLKGVIHVLAIGELNRYHSSLKQKHNLSQVLLLPGVRGLYDFHISPHTGDIYFIADRSKVGKISANGDIQFIANQSGAFSVYPLKQGGMLVASIGNIHFIDMAGKLHHLHHQKVLTLEQVREEDGDTDYAEQITPAQFNDIIYDGQYIYASMPHAILRIEWSPGDPQITNEKISHLGSLEPGYYQHHAPLYTEGMEQSKARFSKIHGLTLDADQKVLFTDGRHGQILKIHQWHPDKPLEVFYNAQMNTTECGSGLVASYASRQSLENQLRTGLSKICAGLPQSISSYNGCHHTDPTKRLYRVTFLQEFLSNTENIVSITKPCSSH